MREWPSIVSGAPEDYYVVINRYGQFGPAFAETGLGRADYETTIADQGSTPMPTGPKMFRTPSRGKYCAASTFRGASCRQS
jgi:hypothetical protein